MILRTSKKPRRTSSFEVEMRKFVKKKKKAGCELTFSKLKLETEVWGSYFLGTLYLVRCFYSGG